VLLRRSGCFDGAYERPADPPSLDGDPLWVANAVRLNGRAPFEVRPRAGHPAITAVLWGVSDRLYLERAVSESEEIGEGITVFVDRGTPRDPVADRVCIHYGPSLV
jgi:hypothetical protein